MEEWKLLDRIPFYEVSNKGRVRSLRYNKEKMLKVSKTQDGYSLVCLAHNSKRHTSYIHRLVAEVFAPTDNFEQLVVNHKNKNREDNSIENLEWATVAKNEFHKRVHGTNNAKLYEIYKLCSILDNTTLDKVIEFGRSLTVR